MKTLKTIMTPLLIALAMGTFTACSDSASNNVGTDDTVRIILNTNEEANVSLDSKIVSVSTQQAQVKLTRDVEANEVNVYVISGSVEITELE